MNWKFLKSMTWPKLIIAVIGFFGGLMANQSAMAHPHVFLDANLELVRNDKGEVTEIRHVWRFDEIFSSSLLLDYDDNGNGQLDIAELQIIANETKASLSEYDFYTHAQFANEEISLEAPDPFLVDYQDGRLLMIMSIKLTKPQLVGAEDFFVSVSDDTYYVAVEIADEGAVEISGNNKGCKWDIIRPDFDALYARDAARLTELFTAAPGEEVEGSDDYLTWVSFSCPS